MSHHVTKSVTFYTFKYLKFYLKLTLAAILKIGEIAVIENGSQNMYKQNLKSNTVKYKMKNTTYFSSFQKVLLKVRYRENNLKN